MTPVTLVVELAVDVVLVVVDVVVAVDVVVVVTQRSDDVITTNVTQYSVDCTISLDCTKHL